MATLPETTCILDRGVFTISLDFELMWGTVDLLGNGFAEACMTERTEVIGRLLDLFVEYEMPPTWCIVGHLFLDGCSPEDGVKHPEIIRPTHRWHTDDWFVHDPCSPMASAPLFYARDLVEMIRDCPVTQEIGSHSFSHVIFGDRGCSQATAISEVSASVNAAKALGIDRMRSFAFPRNAVGHLDVLHDAGFDVYRGVEPHWFENASVPSWLRRIFRLADVLRSARPPVVVPMRDAEGIWNLPGSAMFFPMNGIRSIIPVALRTKRAIKGLNAAVTNKKVFHLWFHPTNMADKTEAMFEGLRVILGHASKLRERGQLDFKPMGNLIPKLT